MDLISNNEVYRFGLAGVVSTLTMEVLCQPIDTMNMKSKVDKHFSIINFVRNKGVTALMRGIQPVIYGMGVSSFIYFVLYKNFKESVKFHMDRHNIDKTSLSSVFIMSAGASTLANLMAIGIYYPYDLVKTRMQIVGEYNYKNIADAIHKIIKEGNGKFILNNFFRGFTLFALTFVSFTTLEFSIYETVMMYLAKTHKDNSVTKNPNHQTHENQVIDDTHTHEEKNMSHVLLASTIAGGVGGLLTNPLEFLVVNKQADPKMTVRSAFKNRTIYDIFLKGSFYRTTYYSLQAVLIFFLLEEFGRYLDCNI